MEGSISFDQVISAIAKRLAAELSPSGRVLNTDPSRRLLTLEQAATYMGRTEEAMQHMVSSGKVPTVRLDRRVFIDVRDLDDLINVHKRGVGR